MSEHEHTGALSSALRTLLATALLLPFLIPGRPLAMSTDTGNAMPEPLKLVDFAESNAQRWFVINDGVMGGVSQSGITRTDSGTAVFEGVLSLENNGGFASVRADVGARDLTDYDGLALRVRGDGRTYQLRLRTDDSYDGVAWRAAFETTEGEWTEAFLPFAEFVPTFRGRILADVPPVDRERVQQIGFLLADKNPGPFRLEIDFVVAQTAPAEDD